MNTPTHIDVPQRQLENAIASEPKTRLKHGGPIGLKDSIPRKKKQHMKSLVLLKSLQI